MSKVSTVDKSNKSASLIQTLTLAFVTLSVFSLLLMGILQLGLVNFPTQQQVASNQQQSNAVFAATQVSGFIQRIFSALETTSKVSRPLINNPAERLSLLQNLLALEPALRQVAILNNHGQEIAKVSRLTIITPDNLINRANSDLFIQTSQGVRHIGSIRIDETTSEPLVTLGVPVEDVFGQFQGVLVAEANLKFMWDLVDRLEIGQTGQAFVVDRQGNLIAFGDILRVLNGENVRGLTTVTEFVGSYNPVDSTGAEITTGITGDIVLSTYVPLGTPDWAVVTEMPVFEAYQGIIPSLLLSGAVLLGVAALSAGAGIYISRRLAAPVRNLTQTATQIAQGNLNLEAPLEGTAEVNRLAVAFNSMTGQLRELIQSLEERVTARTRRLELVATLGERLSAILDFNQLLNELVNQVKESFEYYHAQVYIIDENRQYLVMTAGAGEAGAKMKASGHRIALNAPTSLVARAARTSQIVWVDNVRQADDWLPNPLLPNTYSEMAVPIIVGKQVVGVLDVQDDEIAGLDEGDANLLRSLANQVAVAIRNARLFAEVETALADARAAQERYVSEAWEKTQLLQQNVEYHLSQPGAPPLDQQLAAKLEREALAKNELVVIEVTRPESSPEKLPQIKTAPADSAVVAPIKLQNQVIGAIQLHDANQTRRWNELELTLIQAVADQVAQAAENLRLFEEARERAGREQTIREITDKLRSAPTIETLLETAARELGQRLEVRHTVLELGIETGPNGSPAENARS